MRTLFLIPFILIIYTSAGQNFLSWQYNDRYFSLSLGTGSSTYFGELNYNNEINDQFSIVTAGIEARLLNRVGARIELGYLSLDGSDANAPITTFERQRNLSFESNNWQIRLDGIYYLKSYSGDYHKRWIFDPYLTTGIGYLQYNPATQLGGERFLLREAQTEGIAYKKWSVTLPMGIGAKFRVNEFFNVNFELLYHIAFTDYLDDVSKNYVGEFSSSTAALLADRKEEVGVLNERFYDQIIPGASRGDALSNDHFLLIGIKAEVFIPPGLFGKKSGGSGLKKPSAY